MISNRGICLRCDCVRHSPSKDSLTSCTCEKCGLGCVYCSVGNCYICDEEFIAAANSSENVDKESLQSQNLLSFSCGSVDCVVKCKGMQLLNLKSINAPIPPLDRTLLHTSVSAGDCDLTWKLLLSGANPYLVDNNGLSCIDLATALSRSTESKYRENYDHICRILPKDNYRGDLPPLPVLQRAVTAPLSCRGGWGNFDVSDDEQSIDVPVLVRAISAKTNNGGRRNPTSTVTNSSLSSQKPNLSSGKEILTPLSLARVTSQSDAGALQLLLSDDHEQQLEAEMSRSKQVVPDDLDSLIALVATMGESLGDEDNNGKKSPQDVKSEVVLSETVDDEADVGLALMKLMRDTSNRDDVGAEESRKSQIFSLMECVSCYDTDVVYCCPNAQCNGALCERCLYMTVYIRIRDALYAVPPMMCPGRHIALGSACTARIPTSTWCKALQNCPVDHEHLEFLIEESESEDEDEDEDDNPVKNVVTNFGGDLLLKKYENNAAAILTIRCGNCDKTYSLLSPSVYKEQRDFPLCTRISEIMKQFFSTDRQIVILQLLCKFCEGLVIAREFVVAVLDSFPPRDDRAALDAGIGAAVNAVASLIFDVERRVAFQLAVLQLCPHIVLSCCDIPFCFMCKIMNHHVGLSCVAYQRFDTGSSCQYCPSCGVATMRSEGCNQISCVCGESWNWDTSIDSESNEVGVFEELVEQLGSSDSDDKMEAFRAIGALCSSSQAQSLLAVLQSHHVIDAITLTLKEDDLSKIEIALNCLESYCLSVDEVSDWHWRELDDDFDDSSDDLGEGAEYISNQPQVSILNLLLRIMQDSTLNSVKIASKCMSIFGKNCQIDEFKNWWKRRVKKSNLDNESEQELRSQEATTVISCHTRASEIYLSWLDKEDVDYVLAACKVLSDLYRCGDYINNTMLTESMVAELPTLAPARETHITLTRELKQRGLDTLMKFPDHEKVCVAVTNSLLDFSVWDDSDNLDTIHFLLDHFERFNGSQNLSNEIIDAKLKILESIPDTPHAVTRLVTPYVPWLVENMGTELCPTSTSKACQVLLNFMTACFTTIDHPCWEEKLDYLLNNRQANGKEQEYYGDAIDLYVASICRLPSKSISSEHIGQVVTRLLEMIRSEEVEVCFSVVFVSSFLWQLFSFHNILFDCRIIRKRARAWCSY
mmetsp:Transcript_22103/g.37428  ORF Transcript_22103/g.37428 Transcript_22103/m.37428 type:complete len:1161 (-) Transcript_22103:641-4123(-)